MSHIPDSSAIPSAPPADQVAAFYQPILALDTRRIVGYEVLGRQLVNGNVRSLGPFFTDDRVSASEQLRIDRMLREQAIARLGSMREPPLIFINLKPSWIYKHYREPGDPHTLHLLRKYGIDPAKVCIEITEEEFRGSMSELTEAVEAYRSYGCRIAIDDVGSGFSNYDRIARIRPNLIKVDIHLMKKSAYHNGYLGVLRSFSNLAEQMGASLLVEGVETREDLQRAIRIGSRYVQGYLFAPAEPGFREQEDFSALLEQELEAHRVELQAEERFWLNRSERLIGSLRETGIDVLSAEAEAADRQIEQWLPRLDEACVRVYLCGESGAQLSSNHVRQTDGSWRRDEQYRGSDWSWRPYFIPHLLQPAVSKLSPKYSDLDTHEWIRTLSIPVGHGMLLFLDLKDPEH